VTDPQQTAGPGDSAGPAGEQIVSKNKRANENATKAEATMEEPATPAADGAPVAEAASGEPVGGETEVIVGEVMPEESGGVAPATAPATAAGESKPLGAELEALRSELDERTRDLQRVTAEYANYRKRVDRDRASVVEQSTGLLISALLPILDDLDRAREHGDLVGPFAVMAEQLNAAMAKFGLTGFGDVGDVFDPTRHEAVAHQTSAEVTEPTCVAVMRRGYLLGDRLLRAALVAVADPE
jgi:molecular chaperone GrpE